MNTEEFKKQKNRDTSGYNIIVLSVGMERFTLFSAME